MHDQRRDLIQASCLWSSVTTITRGSVQQWARHPGPCVFSTKGRSVPFFPSGTKFSEKTTDNITTYSAIGYSYGPASYTALPNLHCPKDRPTRRHHHLRILRQQMIRRRYLRIKRRQPIYPHRLISLWRPGCRRGVDLPKSHFRPDVETRLSWTPRGRTPHVWPYRSWSTSISCVPCTRNQP